ncbi:MAG: cell division protein FtsL [Pseudomonadota bacterium]
MNQSHDYNHRQRVIVLVLSVAVFVSAISVVYVTHYQRKLFVNLQSLQRDEDNMNIEWGKLQLEENTWSTTSRIEKIATQQLDMQVPLSEKIIFIQLKTR